MDTNLVIRLKLSFSIPICDLPSHRAAMPSAHSLLAFMICYSLLHGAAEARNRTEVLAELEDAVVRKSLVPDQPSTGRSSTGMLPSNDPLLPLNPERRCRGLCQMGAQVQAKLLPCGAHTPYP